MTPVNSAQRPNAPTAIENGDRTAQAKVEAKHRLTKRLPWIATELEHRAAIVRATIADLDGDLTAVSETFDRLINPKGVLAEDAIYEASEAIMLLRGEAYIAVDGDVVYRGSRSKAAE